jgi:hypothetical protein
MGSPSQDDDERAVREEPAERDDDGVDEAADESFPASDPPSFGSHGPG